jgi:hypothetical protein
LDLPGQDPKKSISSGMSGAKGPGGSLRRDPGGPCSFFHKTDSLAGAVGRANAAFNADIGIDMALDLTL